MVSMGKAREALHCLGPTHVEELDVVEDMVVVGKVVGGDDVDTGILLDLPVGETEPLGLGEESLLVELASPVGLVGLLEVPKDTHAARKKQSARGPNMAGQSMALTGNPEPKTEPS